jgi:hypothetical protein
MEGPAMHNHFNPDLVLLEHQLRVARIERYGHHHAAIANPSRRRVRQAIRLRVPRRRAPQAALT